MLILMLALATIAAVLLLTRTEIEPTERSRPGPLYVASVAITLVLAAVTIVLLLDPTGDQLPRDSRWAAVAMTVVVAYPALVAIVVRKRCPRLLIGAGISCVPRILLSFSFLFFPLLVPAVGFSVAGFRRCDGGHGSSRHLLGNLAVVVLGLAAILALFVTQDPVSYREGDVSGYASDTISVTEGVLSLGLTSSGLGAAWIAGATDPRPRSSPSPG